MGLGIAPVFAGIAMLWLTRHVRPSVRMALVGLGIIGFFVLLRAASFHHLDDLFGGGAPRFSWESVQEMVGVIIVAFAAAIYARKHPRWAK